MNELNSRLYRRVLGLDCSDTVCHGEAYLCDGSCREAHEGKDCVLHVDLYVIHKFKMVTVPKPFETEYLMPVTGDLALWVWFCTNTPMEWVEEVPQPNRELRLDSDDDGEVV